MLEYEREAHQNQAHAISYHVQSIYPLLGDDRIAKQDKDSLTVKRNTQI